MAFVPDRSLINKRLADASHQFTSFDPEKRSAQEIQGFVDHVQAVYDEMKKAAKTDAQKALLDSEMERYQAGYAQKYNADLAAKGRTFSVMITGGSGFDNRRHEKANRAEENRYQEMKDWDDRAQAAILRELRKLAVEEAGGELEVLRKKIADAERNHEFMVKTNAIVRKKISDDQKIKEIQKIGTISDKTAHEILKPDYMGRIGFPAYALSNDTANLKRMRERLAQLEKKEATPTGELTFEGGTIVDNAQADRVQIVFDKIPPEELRTKLKGEGWRWSPRESAWQRMRTAASMNSAKRILGIPFEKKAEVQEIKEIKKELKEGETVEVPEKEIPGLMKKGTLPPPDWEFEKQEDERIKKEAEREINPDDYYRDYETEKDYYDVEDPAEWKKWTESDLKKDVAEGGIVEVPEEDLKAIVSQEEKEPWELTLDEINNIGYIAYDIGTKKYVVKPSISRDTSREPANASEHKRLIFSALAEGKPVPNKVLIDYPELLEPTSAEIKKNLAQGQIVTVPEKVLETAVENLPTVASYRSRAWDAKEKGNYRQAAEFYEQAIKKHELHPQEGELYRDDLSNLKKLHAEVLSLSKVSQGQTVELPESTLKGGAIQPPTPTVEYASWRKFRDHKSETKAVKDALAKAGIEAEVGHGTGTSWSWLEININDPRTRNGLKPPPDEYQYTQEEKALHDKVMRIAQEVTGRHGEYHGNINLMAQKWRHKHKHDEPKHIKTVAKPVIMAKSEIKKDLANGEIVTISQPALEKHLEVFTGLPLLYPAGTKNIHQLLGAGHTLELTGQNLGQMLQIMKKHREPCKPPVHVRPYDRGCPTKRKGGSKK